MMWWHNGGSGWGAGGWVVMVLVMLAVWAIVVGAIVLLVRGVRGRGPAGTPSAEPGAGSDALRALDGRLARGEINAEEYQRIRDLLSAR